MNDGHSLDNLSKQAVSLAEELLKEALTQQEPEEKEHIQLLAKMMEDPAGKSFTFALTDHAFRSSKNDRIAQEAVRLLKTYGVPSYFPFTDRVLLNFFEHLACVFPNIAIPSMMKKLRKDTRQVIIDGEPQALNQHLQMRRSEKLRMNCNRLGEAILGEEEAIGRLNKYLKDLENPNIDYISVKISSIASNINILAWEKTMSRLSERLRQLYRKAIGNKIEQKNKFINLDMEEYRDLLITKELFMKILSEDEFVDLHAGIVLQAYLPDSHLIQKEITEWAKQRVQNGGAPVRIRIVKGANLAMEGYEAELKDWTQAPYHTKTEVDANYKRMLFYGTQIENAKCVNIGVASHNLFDIALAMLLREKNEVQKYVGMEMLEGMAPHQRRSVHKRVEDVLLYAPIASDDEFISAIAYLVRRLEENTTVGNFLRDMFSMQLGSAEWVKHKDVFEKSLNMKDDILLGPQRQQNRATEDVASITDKNDLFENESDTDWTLPVNREWVEAKIIALKEKGNQAVSLQINGVDHYEGLEIDNGFDPSIPNSIPYTYAKANEALIDQAVSSADEAQKKWSEESVEKRSEIMLKIAQKIREKRGELIAIMMQDAGKIIPESDAEITEAIDFAEYYARGYELHDDISDLKCDSQGVCLITPPWNFPFAIPAGGVFAALMTGSAVILKPAPETILTARYLAEICWEAGVPKDVLQFVVCDDNPTGTKLVKDQRIKSIVLTGATSTARLFREFRPDINLYAETGGKNTLYVSAMSDHDLAIRDIILSAFGHAGQKCSACSVVLLEPELYEDNDFLNRLADAAKSLPVGSAWENDSIVTPLILEPSETLHRAFTTLDNNEKWLLKPEPNPDNPRLWSPGIKIGVEPGSWSHVTEFFGPVVSIIKASDLDEGLRLANTSKYGLTAGIHSLDETQLEKWAEYIQAGNLYINRAITGAIVQRQPFGGCKESCFGPGAKAGGPNYLLQLSEITEPEFKPDDREPRSAELRDKIIEWPDLDKDTLNTYLSLAASDEDLWYQHFNKSHDATGLKAQKNYFRYKSIQLLFRISNEAEPLDVLRSIIAAKVSNANVRISVTSDFNKNWKATLVNWGKIFTEDDKLCSESLKNYERVFVFGTTGESFLNTCAETNTHVFSKKPWMNSRLELLKMCREQSLSIDIHRYGNVPEQSICKLY
jgi:RHH-type transcriptional regulator, proline utilization regulon repressor / proline dehydrogenase / delta 1-pyrroline-5-carboxylate dehydrogenase